MIFVLTIINISN